MASHGDSLLPGCLALAAAPRPSSAHFVSSVEPGSYRERVVSQTSAAEACAKHPALLRLRELQAFAETAKNANARIFIGFDKHADLKAEAKALMT